VPSTAVSHRISRFPCERLACMLGVYDHAGPDCLSRLRGSPCCLPHDLKCVGALDQGLFAAQYPARMPPVNAWSTSLRTHTHDSGPMWIATPSSYGTFTHCLSPFLTGAPSLTPAPTSAHYFSPVLAPGAPRPAPPVSQPPLYTLSHKWLCQLQAHHLT